jgi:hypothetical protein
MEIYNFYELLPAKYKTKQLTYKNFDKMKITLPNRIMIVGATGSGKTNIFRNLMVGFNCFSKVYLCVAKPDEPLYAHFIDEWRDLEKKFEVDLLTVITTLDELPDMSEFDVKDNNLILFDDMISEADTALKKVSDIWMRGRKNNLSTIFLSQSFFAVPKFIRDNSDICILKGIKGVKNLNLILSEYAIDASKEELLAMYKKTKAATSVKDFFLIDQTIGQSEELKYRHNFSPIQR